MTARGSYTRNTTAPGGNDWRYRAICRDEDPEMFFSAAAEGTPPYRADVAAAKAVCLRCPVTAECLSSALADRCNDGVWGGLAQEERRELRQRHTSPAQAAELRRRREERQSGIDDIRRHAAAGLTDTEIADRLNQADPAARWSVGIVFAARSRNGIESGYRVRQRTQGAA